MNRDELAEKQVPHSVEAEEATLGSVILHDDGMDDIREVLAPDDFFIVRNGFVWDVLTALYDRREKIDYLTVVEELRRQDKLDEIGGAAYITYLINHTPASMYVEFYAHIVKTASVRRGLLGAASQIAKAAQEETQDLEGVIELSETALFQVTDPVFDDDLVAVSESLSEDMDRVMAARDSNTPARGVPTGFAEIDAILYGLQATDLIIVAGRPGMGKTSLMLGMALAAAASGTGVEFHTLEMSRKQLVQRLIAQVAGLSMTRLRQGNLNDDEWRAYLRASERIAALPLWIDGSATLSPTRLRTKARRAVARKGIGLIIVDYLQLMVTAGKNENRTQEVSQITRGLKALAMELNVPVMAGAQLNRKVEERQDKRPLLSDLRESGSIEQDSDVVMLMYRDDYYDDETERPNQCDVHVAKQRNGPTGVATLFFQKELARLSDLKRVEVDLAKYDGTGFGRNGGNDDALPF